MQQSQDKMKPAGNIDLSRGDDPIDSTTVRFEQRTGGEITLRRLQIFWTVAHTTSLTRAAKMLGVTQPSLSQQLGSLEATIGGQLFHRQSNAMALTDLGAAILGRAEGVLRSLQDFEDALPHDGAARRTVRVAGVTSALRALLPGAMRHLRAADTGRMIDLDMIEGAPAEVIELLHARRADLVLVPEAMAAEAGAGFVSHVVIEDPYVLAVPASLDLGAVRDPGRDLSAGDRDLLLGTVQFAFGTDHSRRIQDWYDRVLPGNRLAARARSFEMVLEMVRAGLGVGIVPALAALTGSGPVAGLCLHRIDLAPRRIVAMLPVARGRLDPYPALVDGLVATARDLRLPDILPPPPFMPQAVQADRGR